MTSSQVTIMLSRRASPYFKPVEATKTMPTYICRADAQRLDQTTRVELAAAITRIHAETTGAQAFFAQVLFEPIEKGSCFIGGHVLAGDHAFIHGHIRAGRAAVDRAALIGRIVDVTATILRIPRDAVWVYISELPPRAMAEYGHLLPEPGDEASWLEGLPDETMRKLNDG